MGKKGGVGASAGKPNQSQYDMSGMGPVGTGPASIGLGGIGDFKGGSGSSGPSWWDKNRKALGQGLMGMNFGSQDEAMPLAVQNMLAPVGSAIEYRAMGGPIDPRKITIVGEDGPEAIVGNTVIPNSGLRRLFGVAPQARTGMDERMPSGRSMYDIAEDPEPIAAPQDRPLTEITPRPLLSPPAPPGSVGEGPAGVTLPQGQGSGVYNAADFPAQDDRQPTRTEELLRQMRVTADAPRMREHSFWKRLGSGVLDGLRLVGQMPSSGDSQADFFRNLSLIGAGGATFGASKGAQAEYQQRQELGRLFGKYQQSAAIDQAEQQRAMQGLEMQSKLFNIKKQGQDLVLDRISAARQDPVFSKGYLTEADKQYIRSQYNVDMTDPNNPKLVEQTVNGTPFIRRANDPAYVRNVTLPDNPSEANFEVQSPLSGTPVQVPGKTIYDSETRRVEAGLDREQRTAQFNANAEMDTESRNVANKLQWQNQIAQIRTQRLQNLNSVLGANEDVQRAVGEMQGKLSEMNQAGNALIALQSQASPDPEELRKAQAAFAKAQSEFQAAEGKAKGAIGKVNGGAAILQQLEADLPPEPAALSPRTVTAPHAGSMGGRNDRVTTLNDLRKTLQKIGK